MPLKWVLHWQPNAGTTVNSQILNEVSQCIESINGTKEGRWRATLTFYKPILRDQTMTADLPRDFLGIQLQEQPNKYYLIIRGQRIVVEADSTIQNIMEKLQSYKLRVALNFEKFLEQNGAHCWSARNGIIFYADNLYLEDIVWRKGFQYQLGDFQLRVGKVVPSHSETLRGIVMEIEYLPISSMEKSKLVMEEFFDIWQEAVSKRSLPGHFMHIEPNFSEYGLLDHYTSQHTAVQYANVMAQLIATVQVVQAARN